MEPHTTGELRCPSCGALVSADAEWCGQCFTSLKEAPPAAAAEGYTNTQEPPRPDVPAGEAEAAAPRKTLPWPCPTCQADNPIEANTCEVCGTSFAALMRTDEAPPKIEPMEAAKWSLIYPGLGHRKLGRPFEGVARGTLFTLSAAMTLLILVSGVHAAAVLAILMLFLVTTILVYAGTAFEAYRMAEGGAPFVSSRLLLWGTVGLVFVAILGLAFSMVALGRH